MTKQKASLWSLGIDTIVAIPALNESAHIENVIKSLSRNIAISHRFEIWVIDGGSMDGTIEIVNRLAASMSRLRLLNNPDRTQASALNLAAREAKKYGGVKFLIRADAHSGYPEGWIERLIETAENEAADSVVVPMQTCGGTQMRDASADLFNSWLGNGGSPHRRGNKRGFVEHGHHALFRLDAFIEAGGYDPRFLANEDAELDVRLIKLGKRIFLENGATIKYVPRGKLSGVYHQFFRNGKFRLRTSLKHNVRLQLRQLAPIGLSVGLTGATLFGVLVHPISFALIAAYLLLIAIASWAIASRKTVRRITLIAATAITAHIAFGFGALAAMMSHLRDRMKLVARKPEMTARLGN